MSILSLYLSFYLLYCSKPLSIAKNICIINIINTIRVPLRYLPIKKYPIISNHKIRTIFLCCYYFLSKHTNLYNLIDTIGL